MTTKEKILNKAISLFNTKGTENITTRHIAKEIAISQGNLHYHFPTKNVVIEELFNQFLAEIKKAERFKNNSFEKEDVIASMKENFKIMYKYRFLFTDNEAIWRRIPKIKKTMLGLFDLKKNQILKIIKLYRSQGKFRKQISEEQILFLADQFIFTITSWIGAIEYMGKRRNNYDYFARFTFRIWLPYLNEKEMKAWEEIL